METQKPSAGLPAETVTDTASDQQIEVIEVDVTDQAALEQRIYETIIRQRTMALELNIAGAIRRDGVSTAHSYIATATAGLLVEILRMQDTDNARGLLERLENDAATKEHNAGTRQVL